MDKTNKYRQKEKGFTLIEVLVAIAILSFGLIAMNFMQTQSVRGNAGAQILTEKIWLASDTIEGLLAEDYGKIDAGNCKDAPFNDWRDNVCTGLPSDYTVSWTVAEDVDKVVKSINVTVKYEHESTNKEFVYEYSKTNLL